MYAEQVDTRNSAQSQTARAGTNFTLTTGLDNLAAGLQQTEDLLAKLEERLMPVLFFESSMPASDKAPMPACSSFTSAAFEQAVRISRINGVIYRMTTGLNL